MKKIRSNNQHYDAWLHWDVTKRCNLNCEYCFGKITDPKVVVNLIDIEKLIATLDKTDKVFRISFTGGEPTMVPNFVEALNAITEKHFISFNTNLITKNLTKIIDAVDPQRILHIHASLHYDELVKKNLLERFIENFKLFKKNGFNIFTEVVAYPPLVDRIYEMKSILESEGIDITFAPFFGKLNDKIYPDAYTEKELELFGISENELQCFSQKNKVCNAGYNAEVVFSNGDVYPCHQIKERIGNVYSEISFYDNIIKCPSKKCGCPLNEYDKYLFEKSVKSFQN